MLPAKYNQPEKKSSTTFSGQAFTKIAEVYRHTESCKASLTRRGEQRTLTNLYNQPPTWLDLAHKRLDEAVFAAYDWKSDLSDEEILERFKQK